MASMKELFPLHNRKKNQRNFIRENIKNVKGCAECIAEKQAAENCSPTRNMLLPSKCYVQRNIKMPEALKYNVKIIKRERSRSRGKYSSSSEKSGTKFDSRASQTETKTDENIGIPTICENCGHTLLNLNNIQPSFTTQESKNVIKKPDILNERINDQIQPLLKDSHQISHQNEDEKREILQKKLQNPTSYKIGEIPKYLKERTAKLEHNRQERETREKLEELLGLKDPNCPPGHMLMPPDEIQYNLDEMQKKFDSLIAELNRMPVSNDSYKVKRRTIQIEKELKELDEKIKLYKSKKVFIKIPSLN